MNRKKRRTVIKRPVFIILLAFALGEVIAVLDYGIAYVFAIFSIFVLAKCLIDNHKYKRRFTTIITKKQAAVFVVIFFAMLIGYFISLNAMEQRHQMYSMEERTVKVQGIVSKVQENSYGWNIYLERVRLQKKESKLNAAGDKKDTEEKISVDSYHQILILYEDKPQIKIGNTIVVQGKLKQFDMARNPGNFDSRKYYMSLGIYGKVEAEHIVVSDSSYDRIRELLYQFHMAIQKKLESMCGGTYDSVWNLCDEKSAVFSAILLGDKTELDSEIKNLYSMSGIAHILAISGLHISFMGRFVYWLFRKRFRFGFSASVSIIIVVGFGMISGMGIATIRAMVMFGLKLLGEVLGRTYDNLTAISTAGIILMMWNPLVIFNSGFQMSFGAIIAIVLIYPIVQNILQTKQKNFSPSEMDEKNTTRKEKCLMNMKKRGGKFVHALFFSLTISLVMNPVIAYNYFQLPSYSVLLNIIVVPLMSVVIISGVLGISMSFISVFAGKLMILPGCAVLELYTGLCRQINRLPFSNVIVGKPSVAIIIIYYLVLLGILFGLNRIRNKKADEERQKESVVEKDGKVIESNKIILKRKRKENKKFMAAMIALVCMLNILIYVVSPIILSGAIPLSENRMKITFLDVGQGDGIFIRTDNGTTITVDGGSTSVDKVGQYRIIPFLKSQCVRKIDYAVMTHADEDHISGLMEMLEASNHNGVKVRHLVLPDIELKDEAYNQMIQLAYIHDVEVLYITKGNSMRFGDVEIKCIYPSVTTKADDRNDYSTVLSVHYDQFSMLLTGDISTEPERELKDMLNNHYTILKVAHHGSKYSTSNEFLQWINPDYSVISVGEHNLYGHPSSEILDRLSRNESQVLRTDEWGGITVCTDGSKIKIGGFVDDR